MSDIEWDRILFIDHAHLYLPILLDMKLEAINDVDGLVKLFSKHHPKEIRRVLDLFCGIGRHSVNLAKRGYEVVGYDISPTFLNEAKKSCIEEGLGGNNPKFYEGGASAIFHTLNIQTEPKFDAIILMFNSFGYRDIEHDLQILSQCNLLASDNCIMIIETENRDWRIANFEPFTRYCSGKIEMHESWKFELESSYSYSRSEFYTKIDESTLHLELSLRTRMRLYSLHEIVNLLEKSGWTYLSSYGHIKNQDQASPDSRRLITVAKKR